MVAVLQRLAPRISAMCRGHLARVQLTVQRLEAAAQVVDGDLGMLHNPHVYCIYSRALSKP